MLICKTVVLQGTCLAANSPERMNVVPSPKHNAIAALVAESQLLGGGVEVHVVKVDDSFTGVFGVACTVALHEIESVGEIDNRVVDGRTKIMTAIGPIELIGDS